MGKVQKVSTREFKEEAVRLALSVCWLHGTSIQEISTSRTIYPSPTACKRGKMRVKSGVVKIFSCSNDDNFLFKGEAFSVGRVLADLMQLRRDCLDILHSRFLRWTKPLSISLPLR